MCLHSSDISSSISTFSFLVGIKNSNFDYDTEDEVEQTTCKLQIAFIYNSRQFQQNVASFRHDKDCSPNIIETSSKLNCLL